MNDTGKEIIAHCCVQYINSLSIYTDVARVRINRILYWCYDITKTSFLNDSSVDVIVCCTVKWK